MTHEHAPKRHRLAMKLTSEGHVQGVIECPFDGAYDAPCSTYPHIIGQDSCNVRAWFGDIGMEAFDGEVELPTIDIDYRWENGEEFYFSPVVEVLRGS